MLNYKTSRHATVSQKMEVAIALKYVKWEVLYMIHMSNNCNFSIQSSVNLWTDMFPLKPKPWGQMTNHGWTQEFKALVSKRQVAKSSGNQELYNQLRNLINRKSEALMADFYKQISRRKVQIRQQSVVENIKIILKTRKEKWLITEPSQQRVWRKYLKACRRNEQRVCISVQI